jgi:hypothetical protein
MRSKRPQPSTLLFALLVGLTSVIWQPAALADGTRQLGTGGGTQVEGSGGGGLVPWAVISGYATHEEIGVSGSLSLVDTGDYELTVAGASVGFRNRIELSLARQELNLVTLGPAIGLPGATLEQDVIGLKARVSGDIIYSRWPQVSVGLQYKRNRDFLLPSVVGARDDSDYDFYVSAAKLWLAGVGGFNGFAKATVRSTRANEMCLLGFGGDRRNSRSVQLESSVGMSLNRHWAIGVEYRQQHSNLNFASEDDRWDAFVAWFPNRHLSVVAAYADLGTIATLSRQQGWYLSIEGVYSFGFGQPSEPSSQAPRNCGRVAADGRVVGYRRLSFGNG